MIKANAAPYFRLLKNGIANRMMSKNTFKYRASGFLNNVLKRNSVFHAILRPFILCRFCSALCNSYFLFKDLINFRFRSGTNFRTFYLIRVLLRNERLFTIIRLCNNTCLNYNVLRDRTFGNNIVVSGRLVIYNRPGIRLKTMTISKVDLCGYNGKILNQTIHDPRAAINGSFLNLSDTTYDGRRNEDGG